MARATKAERERLEAVPNRKLEATAYHESGHAVMAFESGHAIHSMTIIPDPDSGSAGSFHHPKGYSDAFLSESEPMERTQFQNLGTEMILIALAGPAAAERFTGRPDPVGASDDMECVRTLAAIVCGPGESKPFIEWLIVRARNLIARPVTWVQVEALTKALLVTPKMSGKEAKKICEAAIEAKKADLFSRSTLTHITHVIRESQAGVESVSTDS